MCIEKCKHGSGRGLHKPALEIRKGGAFLLYYVGDNQMLHCGDVRPEGWTIVNKVDTKKENIKEKVKF